VGSTVWVFLTPPGKDKRLIVSVDAGLARCAQYLAEIGRLDEESKASCLGNGAQWPESEIIELAGLQ
jgi:hypothetical protein